MIDIIVWDNQPVALTTEIHHFVRNKVAFALRRLVGAPVDRLVELSSRPWRGAGADGGAAYSEVVRQARRFVRDALDVRCNIGCSAEGSDGPFLADRAQHTTGCAG